MVYSLLYLLLNLCNIKYISGGWVEPGDAECFLRRDASNISGVQRVQKTHEQGNTQKPHKRMTVYHIHTNLLFSA